MDLKPPLRVFLASPGDVEEERNAFRELLPKLSNHFGHTLKPLGFEDALATTGPRPQDLINSLVDECDVFVLLLHRRWGQASIDAVGYTAYTEEEFKRALRRFRETGTPAIICLFKQVDLGALADPGEQLKKVLNFRRSLESSGQVMYRTFSSLQEFESELRVHLEAIAHGKPPETQAQIRAVHVPILEDLEPESSLAQELTLSNQAALAARSGHSDEASVLFARLSQTSRNIQVLETARNYFTQVGNTNAAQSLVERQITLIRDRRLAAQQYMSVFMSGGWLNDFLVAFPEGTEKDTLKDLLLLRIR